MNSLYSRALFFFLKLWAEYGAVRLTAEVFDRYENVEE